MSIRCAKTDGYAHLVNHELYVYGDWFEDHEETVAMGVLIGNLVTLTSKAPSPEDVFFAIYVEDVWLNSHTVRGSVIVSTQWEKTQAMLDQEEKY